MAEIPGFTAKVYKNDTEVAFKSFGASFQSGIFGSNWNVDFENPIELNDTDLWSIKIGFAGTTWYLVKNALAEDFGGSDVFKITTNRISSQSLDASTNKDVLNNYGIPKTLVFINPAWLKRANPSAFIDGTTGIVKTGLMNTGRPQDSKRYFHDRIPGKQFEENEDGTYDFQCYYAQSHHDIAQKLCSLIGAKLKTNVPDVPLIDTCTFNSGTKWFDCIKQNFLIWSPNIGVYIDQDGITNVVIEDIKGGQEIDIGAFQFLDIDNPAITSLNRKNTRPKADNLVDHVVVIGRKTEDTIIRAEDEEPDYTPVEIPAKEFDADFWVRTSSRTENIDKYKQMGSYDGDFGYGDDKWTVYPILLTEKWIGLHSYKDGNKLRRIPVEERLLGYDANGLVSKVETKHYYSESKQKIVRSEESHFFKTNLPGTDRKNMEKLRVKTTSQEHYVKPLNLSLTAEMIEDIVLYNEVVVTIEGSPTTVRDDPKSLIEILRQNPNFIDPNPSTTQKVMEMTTYYKSTHINRCDDYTLIKTDVANNILSKNLPQVNSQVLDSPQKDEPEETKEDNIFRREYKDPKSNGLMVQGRGPFYRPAKTIKHDDISTDSLAEQLVERVWLRKNLAASASVMDVVIQAPMPIPLDFTACTVRLSDFTKNVNGQNVTVSGRDYFLKQVEFRVSHNSNGNQIKIDFQENLTVGTQL